MTINSRTPDLRSSVDIIGPRPAEGSRKFPFWLEFLTTRYQVEVTMADLRGRSPRSLLAGLGRVASFGSWQPLSSGECNFARLAKTRVSPWDVAHREASRDLRDTPLSLNKICDIALDNLRYADPPLPMGYLGAEVEGVLVDPVTAESHAYLRLAARKVEGQTYNHPQEIVDSVGPLVGSREIARGVVSLLQGANIIEASLSDRNRVVLTGHPITPWRGPEMV